MTPDALARIHAACFDTPPPWPAPEIAAVLSGPGAYLCEEAGGFAIGRVIADEAELLTLAVAPVARRRGLGRRLLARIIEEAAARGARTLFLEVAAQNDAAISLYLAEGFVESGRRRGYYRRPGLPPVDALVLTRVLTQPHNPGA